MGVSTGVNIQKEPSALQLKVQKFGRFLSGMVMPNIGAFIAWGIITAFFIPTGWTPNEKLGAMVGPMITYLLPLLIGYTGGKMIADVRGGVLGAIATAGVIMGADVPMFLGAMIMGPLGGYIIKKFDQAIEGKIPAGFEMLVNNFSAGIIGAIISILAYLGIGPLAAGLNNVLGAGVQAIVNAGVLPLVSIFIEPAKILFLNNAINHGVLGPIGIQQAEEVGKSIFFLLEANPGPGLGILLAYWLFAKGTVKESAPGAIIIHFFGGIHEIYFPYVLMNPALLLAVIAGGMSGVFTLSLFNAGLVAAPSPGSILAVLAMTPKGGFIGVIAGVVVSAVVSFLIASFFVKRAAGAEQDLESAKEKVQSMKLKKEETAETEAVKLPVLKRDNIKLGISSMSKTDAIRMAGRLLVDSGYVSENYIDAMIQREEDLSTYIGNGVAIPHGVGAAKKEVKQTGISILQFPEGIDFGEEKAYLVVGIAGAGNEHLTILSNLATIMEDEKVAEEIKQTTDVDFVYNVFTQQ